MTKVTHVIYSGLGGHGAVLFALLEAKFLEQASHEVVFTGIEQPRQEYVIRCERLKLPWIYVPRLAGTGYLTYVLSLFRALRKLNADTVFAHGLASVASVALMRFACKKNLYVVLRETQASHLKTKKDRFLLIFASIFIDKIVYLTPEAATAAERNLGFLFKPKRVTVIGNGLDTSYFKSHQGARQRGPLKIGMQSRLQSNKDHKTLIDAYQLVLARRPSPAISLHIAGEGDTMADLRRYVVARGLSDHVIFRGMLPQDELRAYLNELDLYVHCTHGETMSTAIMQAMSMSLPIIASDVWGVSNMIKAGNGLMHTPGSPTDLAEKILYLLDDPEAARALGEKARAEAVACFDIHKMVAKYNALFVCQTGAVH